MDLTDLDADGPPIAPEPAFPIPLDAGAPSRSRAKVSTSRWSRMMTSKGFIRSARFKARHIHESSIEPQEAPHADPAVVSREMT